MYVGLKMITDLVYVTKDSLITEANDLMEKKRLWALPVVEGEKLIGYIQKEDVHTALPSPATTLSKYELPEIMSHITVKDFIRKDVITVRPEMEIEKAAEIMAENNLPGLAVVSESGKLVGYINRSVMLDVLVEEMGLHRGGSRFAIEFEDRPGVMAEVSGLIHQMGLNFVSAASFCHDSTYILVFRVQTADLTPIISELEKRGYRIVGPEQFADQWQ
ncbi:CBS domain-containing protein [bacterium]|nr:CBS domain-containing protein [bacterium]